VPLLKMNSSRRRWSSCAAHREDHRETEQQLHRLGAPDQLEELVEQERHHEHIEPVAPAQALEEEVRVAQEVAHAATPTPSRE
jgi:hypothetical protein